MAKRRGNHEGTIYKRKDGLWASQITLPDKTRKSFYGKTRKAVQDRLSAAKADLSKGLPLPDERQNMGGYLTTWLDGVAAEVRPSTWRIYRGIVRRHLLPAFGHLLLSRLGAQQVKSFYSQKVTSGLSTTTVTHIHGVLHRALKDAVELGLLAINVTERVKVPRRAHHEMATMTEAQARTFMAACAGDRMEALFALALTTGMREGELLALHWHDVSLERRQLVVRWNIEKVAGGFILAETKTSYSRRTIGLSAYLVDLLQQHHTRQLKERVRAGPRWHEQDFVFPGRFGDFLTPDTLSRYQFKILLKRAGLPEMRFHDLRHTTATLAISRGVPIKVVSEMLGHANIRITLEIYGHVLPHMQQVAADTMDAIFG